MSRKFPDGILPPGHRPNEAIDLASRFCYFLDLNNWQPNYANNDKLRKIPVSALARHKQVLYNNSNSQLIQPIQAQIHLADLENGEETITTAVDFLRQVSENERKKEVRIIQQYADHLKKELPKVLKKNSNNDINKLIQRLENFAENPENSAEYNMETFYEELTICINTIRKSGAEMQDRLKQIISNNRTTYADLAADNTLFRFGSDLDGLIKNLIGIKTRAVKDSFASRMQELLIDYIVESIDSGKINLNNFWGAIAGILADFEKFLQKETISDRMKGTLKDFSDLGDESLKQLFESWKNSSSHLLVNLNSNSKYLEELNKTAISLLGIEPLSNTNEIEKRNKEIKARMNRKIDDKRYANHGARELSKKFPDLYDSIAKTDFIKWNVDKSGKKIDSVKRGRVGVLYELIEQATKSALKVEGHAATDVISANIGTLKGDLKLDLEDIILSNLSEVKKNIEDFEKKERKNALNDLRNDFEDMNEEVEKALHELDELLNLPDQKQLFIYHESLKLYVQIEEHKTTHFEGRELQILSALDRIYSMNGFGGLKLPDQELLYNLMLNLSNNAIGGRIKNDVEQYLSIFAGMLMFDDMRIMAKELASNTLERIEYSNLKNIHLYLLNDIYVPSSLVLSYIYKALTAGVDRIKITSKNAAKVVINTTESEAEIDKYLKNHPYGSKTYSLNDWNDMREIISKKTTVQIIFLSAFVTFLRDLEKHFG